MRGLAHEADTMKLRGALVANVSHELRTPLSMIRLGAETLKRGARLPEKQRLEIEDSILREVLHLSHLVENVLDVARMQNSSAKALAFTPVYPRDLLTSLVTTYESWIRSRGFDVKLHIDDAVDEQSWDRDAVSRAVLNLIDNAIKYSGDENKLIDVVLRQTERVGRHRSERPRHRDRCRRPRAHLRAVLPRAVLRHADAPRRRPRPHARAADHRLARRHASKWNRNPAADRRSGCSSRGRNRHSTTSLAQLTPQTL